MPLKTALRNTRFRPNASSRPGGHTARISHSITATAISRISAHAGWRSMNRVTVLARPSPCRPPRRRGLFGSRFQGILTAPRSLHLIVSIFSRALRSGPQDFGGAAIFSRRHPDIGGEEAGETALRREAEIEADIGDRHFARDQRVERLLHDEGIEIEVRGNAGLGAEQPVEVRTRQSRLPRDRI